MDKYKDIEQELEKLKENDSFRQVPIIDSKNGRVIITKVNGKRKKLHNWASNDYLGASNMIAVKNAAKKAIRQYGTGAGSARLLSGGLQCHDRLEKKLAHFLNAEAVLLTSTGFQANLSAITAMADSKKDIIILDKLSHASAYDGATQAKGEIKRFKHNDAADLEKVLEKNQDARRKLVCIETIYSMDGDEAPITEIKKVCDKHNAFLIIDEAHSIGVFGENGRGLCHKHNIKPDIIIGTNSKSLGSQGGYIAGAKTIIEWIVNKGRSFIYSTALAPAACEAAKTTISILKSKPELQKELLENAAFVRKGLQEIGYNVPNGKAPIIPIIIGESKDTLELSKKLKNQGHYAPAIRPPTVAEGKCRLRITITLSHTKSDLNRFIKIMKELI